MDIILIILIGLVWLILAAGLIAAGVFGAAMLTCDAETTFGRVMGAVGGFVLGVAVFPFSWALMVAAFGS